ncbi:MAG: hypothetical protein ACJ746_16130 [Bryobacteraceae bacterium]
MIGSVEGHDPILKERRFGLTNSEDNHGEDVKEVYYYLDATPTHSYLRMLYKYPQRPFPYEWLVEENRSRDQNQPEFELVDTNAFDENRYFDVFVDYAKASPDDILMQITICNRGPEDAEIHVLPQIWFQNTWSWGYDSTKPVLRATAPGVIQIDHVTLGQYRLYSDGGQNFCLAKTRRTPNACMGIRTEPSLRRTRFTERLLKDKRMR